MIPIVVAAFAIAMVKAMIKVTSNRVAIDLTIKTVSKLSVVVGFRTRQRTIVGPGKPGDPEQDWTVKSGSWMGALKSDSIAIAAKNCVRKQPLIMDEAVREYQINVQSKYQIS